MSSETPAGNPAYVGSEREVLTGLVADNRAEVLALLDGLTEEEARRSLVPSLTTLLGLVKHAAFVERVWFSHRLDGRSRSDIGIPDTIDDSFRLTPEDTIEAVVADFVAAMRESDRVLARHRLDDTVEARHGTVSVRWVLGHLIEELARHAGHGDILREQIEAAR